MVAKSIDGRLVLEEMLARTLHYVSCFLGYAQRCIEVIRILGCLAKGSSR